LISKNTPRTTAPSAAGADPLRDVALLNWCGEVLAAVVGG